MQLTNIPETTAVLPCVLTDHRLELVAELDDEAHTRIVGQSAISHPTAAPTDIVVDKVCVCVCVCVCERDEDGHVLERGGEQEAPSELHTRGNVRIRDVFFFFFFFCSCCCCFGC